MGIRADSPVSKTPPPSRAAMATRAPLLTGVLPRPAVASTPPFSRARSGRLTTTRHAPRRATSTGPQGCHVVLDAMALERSIWPASRLSMRCRISKSSCITSRRVSAMPCSVGSLMGCSVPPVPRRATPTRPGGVGIAHVATVAHFPAPINCRGRRSASIRSRRGAIPSLTSRPFRYRE